MIPTNPISGESRRDNATLRQRPDSQLHPHPGGEERDEAGSRHEHGGRQAHRVPHDSDHGARHREGDRSPTKPLPPGIARYRNMQDLSMFSQTRVTLPQEKRRDLKHRYSTFTSLPFPSVSGVLAMGCATQHRHPGFI